MDHSSVEKFQNRWWNF